jgi:hypothetical protein
MLHILNAYFPKIYEELHAWLWKNLSEVYDFPLLVLSGKLLPNLGKYNCSPQPSKRKLESRTLSAPFHTRYKGEKPCRTSSR